MKKRILSLSIAAMIGGVGLAGGASAAVFAPDSATVGSLTVAATPTAAQVKGGFAAGSVATGLSANASGVGSILLVPYFTTQNGNATLLNILNTDTSNGKAVKVRFRGASNSDDVFDFQVYLSPGDVWSASVSQDATTGRSTLVTNDKSCTLPATITNSLFQTNRVSATGAANQTREGYVEIFNMADIVSAGNNDQGTGTTLAAPTVNPLYTAIKHVSGVAPCTPAVMNLLVNDPQAYISAGGYGATGTAQAAPTSTTAAANITAQGLGLSYPTGGLAADWTIINVASTTTYSGQAKAVGLTGGTLGNLVFFPQTDAAISSFAGTGNGAVAAAGVDVLTADPLLRKTGVIYTSGTVVNTSAGFGTVNQSGTAPTNSGQTYVAATSATGYIANPVITAANYDQPDLSTPYVAANIGNPQAQATNLTAQLATATVTNEYLTNPALAAATDWVFSMPTRRYHTAYAYSYAGTTGNGQVFTDYSFTGATGVAGAAVGTLFPTFTPSNTSVTTSTTSGPQICVTASGTLFYGQEEQTTAAASVGFVVSPGTAAATTTFKICGETSVLAFGSSTSNVLGATVAASGATTLPATDGWAKITFANNLPIIGYNAEKAVNSAVKAGVSGNFGLSYNHR